MVGRQHRCMGDWLVGLGRLSGTCTRRLFWSVHGGHFGGISGAIVGAVATAHALMARGNASAREWIAVRLSLGFGLLGIVAVVLVTSIAWN